VSFTQDSAAVVADAREAAALPRPPLLMLRPLEAYLDQHGLGSGPIEAQPIGDGHSNVTYLIRRAGGAWVLRRPPRGPLPPAAHDVLREYRILSACAGTAVRVPAPLLGCADLSVIGAPFYVMAYVEGEVMTTRLPAAYDAVTAPPQVVDELVTALAELHALEWRPTPLAGLSRAPEGYLERQVRRFTRQWEHNRTRDVPHVGEVADWLARNLPRQSDTTLVHGDYRLGNTIFSSQGPPRLRAVLDWEMATLGDPLADVGYLSATYAAADGAPNLLAQLGLVTTLPGFPSRDGVVERYARASGRDVENLRFYEVLALWKSAVFLEGSYARLLRGTTDDEFFAGLKTGVPELAARAAELTYRPAGR
jgi:aminoglycoside phosphotransferase (APT) family kinase protein